jgi:hypothetical protein
VRPYLLTAVRRVSSEWHGGEADQPSDGSRHQPELGEPLIDPAVSGVEDALIARAFLSLPERWRAILWHTQVEQASPAEIAPMLGLTRNGVVALTERALDGLRQAYLREHVARITLPACRPVIERLGAHLGDKLSVRDTALVSEHLARCEWCPVVYEELTHVDAGLRSVVGPLILGSAAAGYLASTASGAPPGATEALPAANPRNTTLALGPGRHAAPMGGRVLATGTASSGGTGGTEFDERVRAAAAGPPEPRRRSRTRHPRRATALAAGLVLAVAGASAMAFALTGNGKTPVSAHSQPPAPSQHASATQPGSPVASSPRAQPRRSKAAPTPPASPSPKLVVAPGPAPSSSTPTPAGTPQLAAAISIQDGFRSKQVVFQAINSGSAATGAVTATITLPSGASFGGGGGRSPSDGGNGGWNCQESQTVATCTHSAIGAGQSAEGTLDFDPGNACGAPVQLSVTSGKANGSAGADIHC